jgi:hypothetical protein
MCGIAFESQEKFATHIQLVHERSDTDFQQANVTSQRKLHHSNSSIEEPSKVSKNLRCIVCDERWSNELELDTHRLLNHCKMPKSDRCAVCRQTLGK